MNRVELVGQPFVQAAIDRLLVYSRHSDPSLVCLIGPAGVGKMTAATELVRRMLCEQSGRLDCPCWSCGRLDLNSHEAVVTTAEPEVGVDEMRELVYRAYRRRDGRRIVLLARFDRVTPAAVQVLLKATEEPTARTTWLLTTRTEPIATIASRAWALRMGALDDRALGRLYGHGPATGGSGAAAQAHVVQLAVSCGGVRPAAKTRFEYLQHVWPGGPQRDELLPDKLDANALRTDIETAAACVARACRNRYDQFGPVSVPRLDRQKAAAIVAVLDEALRLDSVRPYLLLEYVRKRLEGVA